MTQLDHALFYHVAPHGLSQGSVIKPGTWGQLIRAQDSFGPISIFEYLLEEIRLAQFPNKPSRLEVVFALESIKEAEYYRDNYAPLSSIYQVSVDISKLSLHRGNYDFGHPSGPNFIERLHQAAAVYWVQSDAEHIEVLIPTEVTVVQQIS